MQILKDFQIPRAKNPFWVKLSIDVLEDDPSVFSNFDYTKIELEERLQLFFGKQLVQSEGNKQVRGVAYNPSTINIAKDMLSVIEDTIKRELIDAGEKPGSINLGLELWMREDKVIIDKLFTIV